MNDVDVSSDDEFPKARFGLGRKPAPKPEQPVADSDSDSDESVSGAEDAMYGVPSAFGGTRARRPRKRPRKSPPATEFRAEPSKQGGNAAADVPGAWEKHTRGVGSKILEKMGFTGTLGTRGVGITVPLTAQGRENYGEGLGKKTKREKAEHDERLREKKEKEEAKATAAKPAVARWKKKRNNTRFYDVGQGNANQRPSGPLKERIIDMRNGEAREVGSVAEALVQKKAASGNEANAFAAPEFRHNVQLLLDSARLETESAMRALETEKLIGDNARREQQRLLVEIRELEQKKATSTLLEQELRRLKNAKTAAEFASLVDSKSGALFEECKAPSPRFMLPDVLVQLAEPHIRACFRAGAAADFEASRQGSDAARILGALRSPLSGTGDGHFLRLCSRSILREARLHPLDVKNDTALPSMMAAFAGEVHPAVLATFVDDILVPALEASLRGAPADRPPHVWMHVWLPVVGAAALEPLFPALRVRIGRALSAWDPYSGAVGTERAQRELRAWGSILPRRKLHAAIARSVLPVIGRHVADGAPESQAARVAEAVRDWGEVAPGRLLAETLAPALWGAVKRARDELLSQPQDPARSARAAAAYREWAGAVGAVQKYVRHILAAFLFLLAADTRVGDDDALRARIASADVRVLGRNAYRRAEKRASAEPQRRTGVGARASLAEAVGALAQSYGLALLPDGRDRDGRAVFRLGGVRVVLDGARRLVLRVWEGSGNGGQRLEPIALSALMDAAISSVD